MPDRGVAHRRRGTIMYRPPPDLELRQYTSHRIAAVVSTLAEDGVAPAQVLAGSDIEEGALQLSATRVSYAQVATVFRNAVRLARDPAVALRAGARMRLTAYGMYGYALLSSPTREEAIDFADGHGRAMGPVADGIHFHEGDVEAYRYEVLLTSDPAHELYRFALEFTYAAVLTFCRDLYGKAFSFASVSARYPAPAHAGAYRKMFRCPVRFSQPVNELRIAHASMKRMPPLPDPVTHDMAREMCRQFLADLTLAGGGLAAAVRRTLIEQLPGRLPSIEAMAKQMSLHPRTLRRRLEAEGTTYRDLLAEVRRLLAIEYLRKTRMTVEEIASRLGYSDAANFRHAFGRWTGKSPQDYRVR